MNKVNYQNIMESYRDTAASFDEDYDIAMEADDIGNPENNRNALSKFTDMIKKLIEKIIGLISRGILKLKNNIARLGISSKGFTKQLRNREVAIKPYKAVKVICYEYRDSILSGIYTKTINETIKIIKELTSVSSGKPNMDSEFAKMKPDEILAHVWKIGSGENIDSVEGFFQNVKTKFRGEKKEITFLENQLPVLIKQAEGTVQAKIDTVIANDLSNLRQMTRSLESAQRQFQNSAIADEIKQDYTACVRKAASVFAFTETLCNYIHELHVEELLSYRIVVRKFYQF